MIWLVSGESKRRCASALRVPVPPVELRLLPSSRPLTCHPEHEDVCGGGRPARALTQPRTACAEAAGRPLDWPCAADAAPLLHGAVDAKLPGLSGRGAATRGPDRHDRGGDTSTSSMVSEMRVPLVSAWQLLPAAASPAQLVQRLPDGPSTGRVQPTQRRFFMAALVPSFPASLVAEPPQEALIAASSWARLAAASGSPARRFRSARACFCCFCCAVSALLEEAFALAFAGAANGTAGLASAAQLPALFFDADVALLELAPGRAGDVLIDMGFRAARHGLMRRGCRRRAEFGEHEMVDGVLWV